MDPLLSLNLARTVQVLLPLLDHGIDVSNPESETLVEDAVKLLSATLSGSQQLPPPLLVCIVPLHHHQGRDPAISGCNYDG